MTGSEACPKLVDPDALIARAYEVQPIPASVGRLASLVADDKSDVSEIEKVILFDQALTGALLRRANSASSARSRPIGTVREAVLRLGTSTVLSLAMSSCVARRMRKALPEYDLGEGALWAHSVAAAVAAETLKSRAKVRLPGEVVTSALMHDLGKLVMAQFLSPAVLRLLREAEQGGARSRMQAESELLEVHHGELGALVIGHWALPESIRVAVQLHHTPAPEDHAGIHAVFLADRLAHDVLGDEPAPDDGPTVARRATAIHVLGLDSVPYDDLVTASRAKYEELSARYQD